MTAIFACCLVIFSTVTGIARAEEGASARDRAAVTDDSDLAIARGPSINLDKAIAMAIERNLTLMAARTEIRRARGAYESAWGALLPRVEGSVVLNHADHDDVAQSLGRSIVIRRQDNLTGALQVSAPILSFGGWMSTRIGRLGVEAAELTVENARRELTFAVAQSYYQALTAGSLVEVQRALLEAAQHNLAVAVARLATGVGGQLELIRAKGDVVTGRQELAGAVTGYEKARDALAILIGVEGLPTPVDAPAPAFVDEPADDSIAERPDIQLAKKNVEISRSSLGASWSQLMPILTASWQLNHQFTQPSSFGSSDRTRWNALLTLSVPIYSQSRYGDLDQKRAVLQKAAIERDDALQRARLAVRQARRTLENEVRALETAEEAAELARSALLLTQTAYANGTGNSLELTDASRNHRQAEVRLAIARFSVQTALLDLLRVAGKDVPR